MYTYVQCTLYVTSTSTCKGRYMYNFSAARMNVIEIKARQGKACIHMYSVLYMNIYVTSISMCR